jgi:hypothetical protein
VVLGRLGGVRISLPEENRLSALDAAESPLPALTETVAVYAAGLHARRGIGQNLAVFVSGNIGFRAPNVDDYSRLGAEGPAFVIPTRGLKSERAWSGELGMKGEWSVAQASLAYSYTRITDALLRSPATLSGVMMIDDLPIGQVRNIESATYPGEIRQRTGGNVWGSTLATSQKCPASLVRCHRRCPLAGADE